MDIITYENHNEFMLNYFYDKQMEYLVKIFMNKMLKEDVLKCLKNKITNAYSYNFLIENYIIKIRNITVSEDLLSLKYFLENPTFYDVYRFHDWYNGPITHYFFHRCENNINYIYFFQDEIFANFGYYLFRYSKPKHIIEYIIPYILDDKPLMLTTNYCSRNVNYLIHDIKKMFNCNFILN
jgi:hypothetical protein